MLIKQKLVIFLSLFLVTTSFSQIELAEDKVSWEFSVEQKGDDVKNCEATIIGKVKVVKDWHINAIKLPKGSFGYPTSLTFKKNPNYSLIGGVVEPKPTEKYDKYADETLNYHEGSFVFKQKIKINSNKDFNLEGSFSFQTCNEVKCLPDHTADIKVKIKACETKDIVTDQKKLITQFSNIKDDVATHKNGLSYVFVNGKWNEVPKGNSVEFYKKYLILTQKNEK